MEGNEVTRIQSFSQVLSLCVSHTRHKQPKYLISLPDFLKHEGPFGFGLPIFPIEPCHPRICDPAAECYHVQHGCLHE
jgi:hypothetical protein